MWLLDSTFLQVTFIVWTVRFTGVRITGAHMAKTRMRLSPLCPLDIPAIKRYPQGANRILDKWIIVVIPVIAIFTVWDEYYRIFLNRFGDKRNTENLQLRYALIAHLSAIKARCGWGQVFTLDIG